MIGTRIDVLCSVDINGEGDTDLQWCQGEVIEVIQNARSPTVNVKWDPTPDIARYDKDGVITAQVLLPTKSILLTEPCVSVCLLVSKRYERYPKGILCFM